MTTDENYIRYLAVAVASICYNTKYFCQFYILADRVSDFRKHQVMDLQSRFDNFDIQWIDLNDQHRDYIIKTYISRSKNAVYTKNIANYARFLMPDMLPNVKRALYMDSDLIVYGDIADLYNMDLGKYVLGAVADSLVFSDENTHNKLLKYISPNHLYFNAGILLINCEQWRKQKIFGKIAESDAQIRDIKLFNSQDPINKCFENNYMWLPHKYNWFAKFEHFAHLSPDIKKYLADNINDDNICIRHFPGVKPDACPQEYSISQVADLYFFAKMTDFYEEIKLVSQVHNTPTNTRPPQTNSYRVRLFGFIPLFRVNDNKVYLFNFLRILKIIK